VESYVTLRRGDSTPGTRVAYRMTVRQLEALIRLSEAIARSHLERVVSLLIQFYYDESCSSCTTSLSVLMESWNILSHLPFHGQCHQPIFDLHAVCIVILVHFH
jgi:NADH:ubiquinone oxidoreductase subunit F (NADH-binding)